MSKRIPVTAPGMAGLELTDAAVRAEPGRDVLFVPDLDTPQRVWREWRALFEKAGYRTLAPEVSGGRPEHFVERTTERMLDLVDERGVHPHLIGVGHGALVALCVVDELGDRPASPEAGTSGAVAVGGPAISLEQLGIRADAERARPLLLIGGDQDPELSMAAMRERYAAYAAAGRVELIIGQGTAHALAYGAGWRETSAAALAFCNGLSRAAQRRRLPLVTETATAGLAAVL